MIPYEFDQQYEFAQTTVLHVTAQRIELMWPNPEQVAEEGEELLGVYHPMASPGVITLYWDRIGSFFWHHILLLAGKGFPIGREDRGPSPHDRNQNLRARAISPFR